MLNALMDVIRDGLAWLSLHRWHLLATPVMLIVFTVIHESAHAAAAWAQGAVVTSFTIVPTSARWGQITYVVPEGRTVDAFTVSIAPYLLWLACMGIAIAGCIRRGSPPFWLGSTLFIWFYIGAFLDIANAWIGWLNGYENDFQHALGWPSLLDRPAFVLVWLMVMAIGYTLQRKLYGELALHGLTYTAGAAVLTVLALALL